MATVEVYPKLGTTYDDAAGVPITSAGAIVDISKYILDALKRGFLLTWDPLDVYQPDDRTGIGPSDGAALTFASFDAMTSFAGVRDGQSCVMLGHSSANDGGGGVCYWDATATDEADNGTIFGTGTGRWRRAWDGKTIHAAWFGVKADVRYITDAVVTGGSATVTSASLLAEDLGKSVLVNTPSQPVSGTATTTLNDNFVSGTGDSWSTELADAVTGNVSGYGVCYINGTIYAFYVAVDHGLYLLQRAVSSASGLTVYKETQLASTVLSASDGSIGIAHTPVVSGTSVDMIVGTDDTAAIRAAIATALAVGATEVVLPAGNIGISGNIGITDVHGFTIRGAGINSTVLVDLRKASTEYPYPVADSYFGALSAFECSNVTFSDMSYDGSVPRIGMAHSSGGVINTSGARIGFFMRHTPGGAFIALGAGGNCGARDEHCYADGESPDFVARDCVINPANGNAINLGFGDLKGKGCLIVNNVLNSAYSCIQVSSGSAIVSNNECSQDVDIFSVGTDAVVLDIVGRAKFTNNIIRDVDSASFGVAAVSCYGNGALADTVIEISGNTIMNVASGWQNGEAGAFSLRNFGGSAIISGNDVHNCTAFATGGKFVDVSGVGAAASTVFVRDNKFGSGSNMTVGVNVDAAFTGTVVVRDNVYAPGITSRVAGKYTDNPSILSVTTTGGGTALTTHDAVIVTANGAVPIAFPNAANCAGKRITVKNGPLQAGTTTVTPASSTVDGSATSTLVGANVFKTYLSDGASWFVV